MDLLFIIEPNLVQVGAVSDSQIMMGCNEEGEGGRWNKRTAIILLT